MKTTLDQLFENLSFQTLFDSAADAFLIVDKMGRIAKANCSALVLLHYKSEEISGLSVEELMPERFRSAHVAHRHGFFEHPEKRAMGQGRDLFALTKSGEEIIVDIGLSPIEIKDEKFVLMTLYPAEKRREAELALKISEERLRLAKSAADLGVFDYDMTLQIMHWDDRMQKLWGMESRETIAFNEFLNAIHSHDRLHVVTAIEQSAMHDTETPLNFEYRVVNDKENKELWVSSTALMHYKAGKPVRLIGVVHEVSEQKKLEQFLQEQRLESETILKQQTAALTTSAIAHELNQPLAAISAYSEVALHEMETLHIDSEKLAQALQGCVLQAQRAGSSLHELLAFLQEDKSTPEAFDINKTIKEAFVIAQAGGFKVLRPVLNLEKNLPQVIANKMQVQKVILNLLINSVEALRVSGSLNTPVVVNVRTNSENTMCHVIVKDQGIGISPNAAKRIFEPFFTTKPTGIGMGLAISKALIESNGGQLWYEPNVPSGAIFHFTLPLK